MNPLQRIQETCVPVLAPDAGVVEQWCCKPGNQVSRFDTLLTLEDMEITSPVSGVVRALMVRPGVAVARDAVVCYVQPHKPVQRPAVAVQRPAVALVPAAAPAAPAPRRGSAPMLRPLDLQLEDLTPAPSVPATTQRKTYHHATAHVLAVTRLALKCRLDPDSDAHNESEIVRAALADFLALPYAQQRASLARNRQAERSGRYGVGRRPAR